MTSFRVISFLLLLIGPAGAGAEPAPWVGVALNGAACTGGNPGNFGPFDYITNKEKLPVVERRHFTVQVEQLVQGETAPHPMGDVSYTLVRFPNHHRALYSAVRYSLGEATKSTRENYHAECFLQRAINFSPADPVPRMLFGLYLHRLGHLPSAIEHYQVAEQMAPNDPNLLYNYGLALFDAGRYEEANHYAVKAYNLGVEFPALKRKLKNAGYWQQ
jgi:tetratricopeptide (TPR) repeat protein